MRRHNATTVSRATMLLAVRWITFQAVGRHAAFAKFTDFLEADGMPASRHSTIGVPQSQAAHALAAQSRHRTCIGKSRLNSVVASVPQAKFWSHEP
jgi:hypothetical protein